MKNLFQGLAFLLTLSSLSVLPGSGSAQITFIRNYGYPNPYFDWGQYAQQTSDGGYMVTGFTNTLAFYDIFLIKTNTDGMVGIREIPGAETAATPKLLQNYPNPFQLRTTIRFSIPDKNVVSLKIFHASGREIGVLVSEELLPGVYESSWEPADLPCGIYWCRLQAGQFTTVKKLVLIR